MRRWLVPLLSLMALLLGWALLVADSADPCYEDNTCPEHLDTAQEVLEGQDGAAATTDGAQVGADSHAADTP